MIGPSEPCTAERWSETGRWEQHEISKCMKMFQVFMFQWAMEMILRHEMWFFSTLDSGKWLKCSTFYTKNDMELLLLSMKHSFTGVLVSWFMNMKVAKDLGVSVCAQWLSKRLQNHSHLLTKFSNLNVQIRKSGLNFVWGDGCFVESSICPYRKILYLSSRYQKELNVQIEKKMRKICFFSQFRFQCWSPFLILQLVSP